MNPSISMKLKGLIKSLNIEEKTELLAADRLVSLIEAEDFLQNQKNVNAYLEEILNLYNLQEFSHIILGCTHFPVVKENIEQILNKKGLNVKVIDGNAGIGRNLLHKIKEKGDFDKELNLHIINTEASSVFEKRAKEIINAD